jgi:hypothetical protein
VLTLRWLRSELEVRAPRPLWVSKGAGFDFLPNSKFRAVGPYTIETESRAVGHASEAALDTSPGDLEHIACGCVCHIMAMPLCIKELQE